MSINRNRQAFALQIKPRGEDKVAYALERDVVIIASIQNLLEEFSWEEFREKFKEEWFSDSETYHKAGAAASGPWMFIKEMELGDIVVSSIPSDPGSFHVAKIVGDVEEKKCSENNDSEYLRSVQWLTDKENPIPVETARAVLSTKLNNQKTCISASDALQEIFDCLKRHEDGEHRNFYDDLRRLLVEKTLGEIRDGKLKRQGYGFEKLIAKVMDKLGASSASIVNRFHDKGADIVATFEMAGGLISQTVAIQAKHFDPDPERPVSKDVVMKLIDGMNAVGADMGMIITSGTIDGEAKKFADQFAKETGKPMRLLDGEEFSGIVVDKGLDIFSEYLTDQKAVDTK